MKSVNVPQQARSPFLFVTIREDGSSLIHTKNPMPCKKCNTTHFHFVNRGTTLCLDCDEGELR